MGRFRLAVVVRVHRIDRAQDVLHRAEREEPFTYRKDVAETGLLSDHGPTGGEIGGAAIAEPSTSEPDVLIFRDRELPTGRSHVIPIGIRIHRELEGVAISPACLG